MHNLTRVQDPAVREILRQLMTDNKQWQKTDGELSPPAPLNMGSQIIKQVADPVENQDVVTKAYGDSHYGAKVIRQSLQVGGDAPLNLVTLPGIETIVGKALYGTHSLRLAMIPSASLEGQLWWETDRLHLYQIQLASGGVYAWMCLHGMMSGTLSPDLKPADLGTADVGFTFASTDFTRNYVWSGVAWADATGQPSRDQIGLFATAPGTGWQLCDGSTVSKTTAIGGLTNVTVPNYSTAAYIKAGTSATIGPTAASGVTTSVSAGTPAGSVSAPVFSGSGGTTSNASAGVNLQVGTADGIASKYPDHSHTFTPSGTNSAPTFTGSALAGHTHGPNTLELRNSVLLAYYRL